MLLYTSNPFLIPKVYTWEFNNCKPIPKHKVRSQRSPQPHLNSPAYLFNIQLNVICCTFSLKVKKKKKKWGRNSLLLLNKGIPIKTHIYDIKITTSKPSSTNGKLFPRKSSKETRVVSLTSELHFPRSPKYQQITFLPLVKACLRALS